jgi:hypothetical protein
MKKTFLFVLLMCCFAGVAKAQNIQLHYDLGRAMYNSLEDRPWVTTTVEMFKADKWGSTFFFVDMDYTDKGVIQLYSMGTMSDAAATEKVSQAGIADNLTSMLSVLKSFRS